METPMQIVKSRQETINENIQKLKENYTTIEHNQKRERAIIEADPPEVSRLKALLQDFQTKQTWSSIIAMADIYRKGAFPRFLPNETLAIELYRIVSMSPDGEMAGEAQTKYVETRKEIINNDDRAGKPLPTYYGEEALAVATVYIQRTPMTLFEKPHFNAPKPPAPPPLTETFDTFDFNFNIDNLFNTRNTDPDNITPQRSDGQNVHDHSVVQTAKENIKRLQSQLSGNSFTTPSTSTTKEQIIETVLSTPDMSEKDRLNALEVIEKLSTSKHSSLDVSETDALSLVWQKINNTSDQTLQNNLKETLGKQLASAYENGHVVCSTGKIARILGTLDGVEDNTTTPMKPMWVIKEEIGNLAAKVRDNHISQNQQNEEKMKQDFENQARNLYINQLGLRDSIISPIIEMYKEGF